MDALERLKTGECNSVEQAWQADGTVILTVLKAGDPHIYKARVKNLYKPDEEVVESWVEKER